MSYTKLRVAGGRYCAGVRVGAQGSELRLRVRHRDESYGPGVVLAVERCWMCDVEYTAVNVRIVRIVEPEPKVEGVDRRGIALVRIKTEYLIEQDRLNRCRERTLIVGLNVRLIPAGGDRF